MNAVFGNLASRGRASKLLTVSLALAASLAMVVALSACGSPAETSDGSGSQSQGDSKPLEGADLPEGFPESVPLFNGKVTYTNVLEMDDVDMWTIDMEVPDSVDTYAAVKAQLEGAGFTEEYNSADGDVIIGNFGGRTDYAVMASTAKALSNELTYVVNQLEVNAE